MLAAHLRRRALAVVVGLGSLLALCVPSARAGEYDVYWCATPSGANVPVSDELQFGWNVSFISASSSCGTSGGSVVLGSGTDVRYGGASVTASVTAPTSAISFKRLVMNRAVALTAGADLSASPYFALATVQRGPDGTPQGSLAHENCAAFAGCFSLNGDVVAELGNAHKVTWSVGCGGSTSGYCSAGSPERAFLALRSIHLVVSDDAPPTGTATTGTALTAPVLRAAETAQVSTFDWGSGILEIVATLDGRRAGVMTGVGPNCHDESFAAGARDYIAVAPCKAGSLTGTIQVDTTVVPDGERRLRIVATDASGNAVLLADRRVPVDNVPAPVSVSPPIITSAAPLNDLRSGDTLVATPGGWSGQGLALAYQWERWSEADGWIKILGATKSTYQLVKEDASHKIHVVVTATNADSSVSKESTATEFVKSGATVQVASAGPQAVGDGPAPQLVVDREQRTVQVHYGAKIVVTGKLVDADGAPIGDADVDVFEQVSVVGAPWKKITTIKTDSQGGYSFKPDTKGSRVLRFAYSAQRDTGDYRATREVVISVTAAMSIRAVQRTISSRGLIHLKGRVRARPLPESGTWVEVQVLDAGVWRTIGTRRTTKRGRWSFRHRVRSVSRVTFAFRVRLRPVANVPAAESKSMPVKVRVR